VSLGLNYYDIKVKDSIVEPSSQFIVNDCFFRDDGQRSAFCDRLTYDTAPTSRQLVSDVFAGFINLNQESVRGLDLNWVLSKEVDMFGSLVDFTITGRANHLLERSSLFIGDDGTPDFDDDTGEFGFPRWTGRTTFRADYDEWRLSWTVRYIGDVEQDEDGIDPFVDVFGNNPDGTPNEDGALSDTCTGIGTATVAGDGIFCRDVGFADEQFLHTVSLRYRMDGLTIIAGIDNVFNTAPPLVDSSEVLAIANTAIGNGYDYDGREFFLSIRKEF
jgi:iron complex outermembrane receptor protein